MIYSLHVDLSIIFVRIASGVFLFLRATTGMNKLITSTKLIVTSWNIQPEDSGPAQKGHIVFQHSIAQLNPSL